MTLVLEMVEYPTLGSQFIVMTIRRWMFVEKRNQFSDCILSDSAFQTRALNTDTDGAVASAASAEKCAPFRETYWRAGRRPRLASGSCGGGRAPWDHLIVYDKICLSVSPVTRRGVSGARCEKRESSW
ncbi:hypothetical protein EVAR_14714_1 [Eumeta japonica]|uniref:Uncharacterized protein n=1 Tax=Eumeta variegata TaxID=151549 RepID=A0A4C1U284_EUMVA|nr:hypothetical protein EVAR_14714_1 [Eumeta japonica]